MPFTQSALEKIAEKGALERGQRYFEEGRVRDLRFVFPSSRSVRATGTVFGTTRYRCSMEVDLAEDAVTFQSCTCPYDWGGACKHVVALGLAAIGDLARSTVSAEPTADAPKKLTEILNEFFSEHGIDVNSSDAKKLAARLAGTGTGEMSADGKPPIRREYGLDGIRLVISYDRKRDALGVRPEALYGTQIVSPGSDEQPDHGEEKSVRGRRAVYSLIRDRYRENQCIQNLDFALEDGADAYGVWHAIGGRAIFEFIRESLSDQLSHYEVRIESSAKRLFAVHTKEIDAKWKTSMSETGFMDFSVAWHCAGAGITEAQLAKMMEHGDPYIRRADGSFLEPENADEVGQMLDFMKHAKHKADGTFAIELSRAPEMLDMIGHAERGRKVAMDAKIKTFLKETQSGKPVERVVLPASLDGVLRPYQKRGVEWGVFLRKHGFGGILADEMGLGKTLQVLALLSVDVGEKRAAQKRPSLVVCPKTLIGTWMQEAAKFTPKLKTLAIDGPADARLALMKKIDDADLVITSYPCVLRDVATYAERGLTFRYCVLDEAQYVKNGKTGTARAVKRIIADHRLALSGTPLENGVHELWSIFDFLMPGFLGDQRDFRLRFERPIHDRRDKHALKTLQTKIRPFVLRRTKASEVKELPPKIEQTRECALTPAQITLYAQTLEAAKREVYGAVERKGFARSRIEILAALLRLRQACDHPALVMKTGDKDPELSGKIPHAMELIDEAVGGGHKVLLFSSFTGMLDIVRAALDERGIGHATIEGKTRDRDEAIKRFNDDPSVKVFLLSLKAGGVGLTLTAADTVILFDPWWNPMAENQAMDRAHRIGQTKTVNVYKLIAKGTIEERVLELQKKKRAIFDALMTENGEGLDALTWSDVRGLFET
jgi:superfamily II DNA or RNA helicase